MSDVQGRCPRAVNELQHGCEELSVDGRCPGLCLTVPIWIGVVEARRVVREYLRGLYSSLLIAGGAERFAML